MPNFLCPIKKKGITMLMGTMVLVIGMISPVVAKQYGPPEKRDLPPRVEPRIFIETAQVVGLNLYDAYQRENGTFNVNICMAPAEYSIQSDGDTNYRSPQHPSQVGRWSRGYDFRFDKRGFGPVMLHTIYLCLPYPLKAGKTYTINVGPEKKDKTIKLEYKGDLHTSRAVKVNHYGYLPQEAVKIAYVGDWLGSLGPLDLNGVATDFYLYDVKARKKVFRGKAVSRPVRKEMYGEDLYELDFSSFQTPGTYVLVVPGVGASYEFKIAKDAYKDIAYLTFRGLYHQRCGIALEKKYTNWVRMNPCHRGRVEISDWKTFSGRAFRDNARKATGKYLTGIWGGYHDAGDYDRQSRHFVIATKLLEIYEAFPQAFKDNQYNIPESGNGVPDILDEARWVIDWGIRMQREGGGVRGQVETTEHPNWGVGPDSPVENAQPMYVPQPEPMSSLLFAAPAAKLSRAFKGIGEEKEAELFLKHAQLAYEYAKRHTNEMRVVEVDKLAHPDDMWAHAAIELYRTTGEERYHQDFLTNYWLLKNPNIDLVAWENWRLQYVAFSYATAEEVRLDRRALTVSRDALRRGADSMLSHIEKWGYRVARYHSKIWYGFGGAKNFHEPFMYAYLALGDKKYRDAIVHQADTYLGVNPLGMCWITGAGYRAPVNNLHIPSLNDGIPEPVPGIEVWGPLSVKDAGDGWYKQYFRNWFPAAESVPPLHSWADLYPFARSSEFRIDVEMVQMVCLMLFMDTVGQAGQ